MRKHIYICIYIYTYICVCSYTFPHVAKYTRQNALFFVMTVFSNWLQLRKKRYEFGAVVTWLSMIQHAAPQCLEQVINQRLTHWGRVTHICVSDLITIGSDNGLSPGRRQAIIWPNARMLLIGPLGIYFSEILIEIHTISLKKMHSKCRLQKGVYFVSASMW